MVLESRLLPHEGGGLYLGKNLGRIRPDDARRQIPELLSSLPWEGELTLLQRTWIPNISIH